MQVLFIGNSITKGEIGESFVDLFKIEHPEWKIKNAGVNGDCLLNISQRISKEKKIDTYDYIIIEAGYNDIIIPYLLKKGLLYRIANKHLLMRGKQPLGEESFKQVYLEMIDFIRGKTDAKIIVTTVGCINENLSSTINRTRIRYNCLIKEIAKEKLCLIADVAEEFELILKDIKQTDYLLDSFIGLVYKDRKKTKDKTASDMICKKRDLYLSIDGVHLNTRGAQIYKNIIEKNIRLI